ncbi:MAG TPA: dolichyl-phosphate beta-glucosyltransferase [Candidatus Acidoferrum sp.]|nr:dolichyl-phosphate beta-glucosyltransferase [Candidatus Acidoferrum sp.]
MRRSISIVIPAYNEQNRLGPSLQKIRRYLDSSSWDFCEIVVVNDGSRDKTSDVARNQGARVLENPGNRGKGYTVRHGMLEAKGDWVLYTDADLSSPIEELEKLWAAVARDKAQVAIGSRAVDRSLVGVHQPLVRELSGRFFNLVMRMITGLPFRDTQCGFKLFEAATARDVFSRQQLEGFGFDVEVLFIAQKLGRRALEVPVRWDNVEGTKVSLWSGAKAFVDPLKVRLNSMKGLYR